jgi:uncharacterized membrane protein
MPELYSSRRLDQPRAGRTRRWDVDPEAFARISERVARFLGTGRFLALQTVMVIVWIGLNLSALTWRWDPYPFILLNLAFSTQAAYAAPLILLAQNRQDDRDRIALEEDRARAERTKADTEFLARELAALRLAVGEVATRDYLRGELDKLAALVATEPAARPGKGDRKAERLAGKPDRAGAGGGKPDRGDRVGAGGKSERAERGDRGDRAGIGKTERAELAERAGVGGKSARADRGGGDRTGRVG